MTHRETVNNGTLEATAEGLGMMRADYWNTVVKPEIQLWIADDVQAAKALSITQIPLIYVAGRRVDHWKSGDENLLPAIIAEATR